MKNSTKILWIKRVIVLIAFVWLSQIVMTQVYGATVTVGSVKYQNYERIKARAAQFYQDLAYAKGVKLYHRALGIVPTDDTVRLELAYGYYQLHDYDSARVYYELIMSNSSLISENEDHYLHYAETLITAERYQEASVWFRKYQDSHPDDLRVEERLYGLSRMLDFYNDSIRFEVELAEFNTDGYDFAPTYYEDELLIVSSRPTMGAMQFLKPKYNWDNTYFLNIFRVEGESGEVELYDKRIKSGYHEGPLCFYDGETRVIFTRNNYTKGELRVRNRKLTVKTAEAKESNEGVNKLKLFLAERDDEGNWKPAEEIWFNSDEYSCGHPTVSADGQRLYFSSDKARGYGKTDIYMSTREDDKWGRPVNLGAHVNTEGSEMFPFVDENEILYFASNGRKGLGGLDIFKIDLKDPNSVAENLGYPMNSAKDDFGITIKKKNGLEEGYFSSNREGGIGLDDVYAFRYIKSGSVPGLVIDMQSGQPLANAQVGVKSQSSAGKTVEGVTDESGVFAYDYSFDEIYSMTATKEGYSVDHLEMDPTVSYGDTIRMYVTRELRVEGVITDQMSGERLESAQVLVTNQETQEQVRIVTEADGYYSFAAESGTTYSVELVKYEYLTKQTFMNTGNNLAGVVVHDGEMERLLVGKELAVEPILYDLDKHDIRNDAKIILDQLVVVLRENPSIIIEVGTHTDSRASALYNRELSDRRAQSVISYLEERGVSSERVVSRAYGESQLLNHCANSASCEEEMHQLNRRAEVKIIGFLSKDEQAISSTEQIENSVSSVSF
ncbi:hypothetical protein BFP72_13760 [Reichenbachiella sp. 5M10]|uniref:OmpA family protein n=1 Tax=Reichenbachiella sp. 5M10 TaxID=1889772 RepID=UPI000C150285|nr:carboxypeptidase regulatory-like domain-containing protein [Reichenbachiella sp. 5M10]PIB36385.1 hypothetical protein BFP72_13760 [Reichenbachiella sp. 5M10]